MVWRDSISKGIHLRLQSTCLKVPAGTLGVVEGVETLWTGEWFFTVRWLNLRSGSGSCAYSPTPRMS